MIGVIGDYNPQNVTHVATARALETLPGGATFEWIATDEVSAERMAKLGGFFVAPGSPYRDMNAVLEVIRLARERGVPLVGT